jgi:NADH:ubiquinone oxidoreductase subunit H
VAEYTSVIVMAAIAVTLFLGGWSLFGLESRIAPLAVVVIMAVVFILLALSIIWRNARNAPPYKARTMGIVVAAVFALTGIIILATRPFNDQSARVWFSVLVFIIKIFALIYGYMWVRWTWLRYRYDHLMQVGWKWLIPAGLINIVLTAIWYILALPKQQGGLFNDFLIQRGERFTPTGKGMAYFIATAFVLTLPIVWGLLVTINGRPRGLSLARQQK